MKIPDGFSNFHNSQNISQKYFQHPEIFLIARGGQPSTPLPPSISLGTCRRKSEIADPPELIRRGGPFAPERKRVGGGGLAVDAPLSVTVATFGERQLWRPAPPDRSIRACNSPGSSLFINTGPAGFRVF